MIAELVPQEIERYLREKREVLTYDIRTILNGKANDLGNLRQDLEEYIINQFRNSIK